MPIFLILNLTLIIYYNYVEKKAEKLTIYLLKFLPKLIIINNVQYLTV